MTEKSQNLQEGSTNRIVIPLKVGLFVGSFVVGLPVLTHLIFCALFWLAAVDYNRDLFWIPLFQFLVIVIIGSYIVSQSLYSETGLVIRNDKDAWQVGILAALAGQFLDIIIFYRYRGLRLSLASF